jgi:hypothetical protein
MSEVVFDAEEAPFVTMQDGTCRIDFKNFSERAKKRFNITNQFIENEEYYWSIREGLIKDHEGEIIIIDNKKILSLGKGIMHPKPKNAYRVTIGYESCEE